MTNPPPATPTTAKTALSLSPEPAERLRLRAITPADQERLRQWKNLHRRAFFHQDIITPQMQARWFAGYLQRADDWMFVVLEQERPRGCLGWRLWQGRADLYNVIRGEQQGRGDGLMSRAMALLLSHLLAEGRTDIVARVVTGNPALGWYQNNGFVVEQEMADHFLVKLELTAFTPHAYRLSHGD